MSEPGDAQVGFEPTEQFEWAEPPPMMRGGRASRFEAFVEQLKTQPGRWAIFSTRSSPFSATKLRRSHPGVEWTTRTVRNSPDGPPMYTLYGRWVGET